jgi:hypothetical protein
MTHHVFGIRHHGPGSARSLRDALARLRPDVVLIEGPPEADGLLPLAIHENMRPPVAILAYDPESPASAVYYPFAVFSPEWQAIQYAAANKIQARFMDLPVGHRLALDREHDAAQAPRTTEQETTKQEADDVRDDDTDDAPPANHLRQDPLSYIALAAGYSDGERWWEHMVEERRDSAELFQAINEAMTALRQEPEAQEKEPHAQRIETLREAHMRKTIRAAQKEGYERIAVVCGAWHAPALAALPPAKEDDALLKGLPSLKMQATWVPWTYGRLTYASGYGAGVTSPGWYHHLWQTEDRIAVRWLTQVAHALRAQGIDASSAHIIEAVRLSETLASMRGRPLPGLPELNDAVQSVLLFGETLPLRLVHDTLIVGERLGEVPEDAPMTPLQRDLAQQQKSLRLKPEASDRELVLDLREANDLARSCLLRRLQLLDVPWGQGAERARGKGTFREAWRLQWKPEFAIKLIEAGAWGNTVAQAASTLAVHRARESTSLPALTALAREAMYADLGDAVEAIIARVQAEAAIASDIAHLMRALPELAPLLRYGDVRKTSTDIVQTVVDGLVVRICVGLSPACSALADEPAGEMFDHISAVQGAIALLDNAEHTPTWHATLARLLDQAQVHGVIQGRCCRLLLDAGALDETEAARRFGFALSTANDPTQAAAWVDGFLRGSGQVLIYDEALWNLIDAWVSALPAGTFTQLLPLLRRTFATFTTPERRAMGERVRTGAAKGAHKPAMLEDFDTERAQRVLPLVSKLLGLKEE